MSSVIRTAACILALQAVTLINGCGPATAGTGSPAGGTAAAGQVAPAGTGTVTPAGPPNPAAADLLLQPFTGDYSATFISQVGTRNTPTGTITSNTIAGLVDFTSTGTISLRLSAPGVISIPIGEVIPGVPAQDILFGESVAQNPVDVAIVTPFLVQVGDFNLHSITELALPADADTLLYNGCTTIAQQGTQSTTQCVPVFFRAARPADQGVSPIHFTVEATTAPSTLTPVPGTLILAGQLRTIQPGVTIANAFIVPVAVPFSGTVNDTFIFSRGATFQMTVTGTSLIGSIQATGVSSAGLVTQPATLTVNFQGTKR